MQRLLMVLWGLEVALAAELPDHPLTMKVLLFNYASVPGPALARAQHEAAGVYARIGVRTEWVECKSSSSAPAIGGICAAPRTPATPELRLLSRPMAARLRTDPSTCGLTLFPAEGGPAVLVNVFAHRAEDLAIQHDLDYAVVLGHLIAHELGHVLLGAGSHSRHGIMRIPWGRRELHWAAKGSLNFTPGEAAQIRTKLATQVDAA
jgi:hypothetical protein